MLIAGLFVCAGVFSSAALAEQSVPHDEDCAEIAWGYLRSQGDEFGTVNTCTHAVEIWFMPGGGKTIHATVEPRAAFRTGLTMRTFDYRKRGWIAAVCPAGYAPTVSVSQRNWDAVLHGRYECDKR
jgi:hypothetical protein